MLRLVGRLKGGTINNCRVYSTSRDPASYSIGPSAWQRNFGFGRLQATGNSTNCFDSSNFHFEAATLLQLLVGCYATPTYSYSFAWASQQRQLSENVRVFMEGCGAVVLRFFLFCFGDGFLSRVFDIIRFSSRKLLQKNCINHVIC